jgi:hypothetical protein
MFSILNAWRIVFIPMNDSQRHSFPCARWRDHLSIWSSERGEGAQARRAANSGI